MFGLDFLKLYQSNPTEATIIVLVNTCVIVFGLLYIVRFKNKKERSKKICEEIHKERNKCKRWVREQK